MKVRIEPLDALFSLYIRARDRWTCQVCGRIFAEPERGKLQCSHFMSRRHQGTRYYDGNACAKCFACHQRMTGNPITFTMWIMDRVGGQAFAKLQMMARKPTKWTPFDREMIAWELYEKLEKIETGSVVDKARKLAASVAKTAKRGRTAQPSKIMARTTCS